MERKYQSNSSGDILLAILLVLAWSYAESILNYTLKALITGAVWWGCQVLRSKVLGI